MFFNSLCFAFGCKFVIARRLIYFIDKPPRSPKFSPENQRQNNFEAIS